jgi:hypothetical protein
MEDYSRCNSEGAVAARTKLKQESGRRLVRGRGPQSLYGMQSCVISGDRSINISNRQYLKWQAKYSHVNLLEFELKYCVLPIESEIPDDDCCL